MDLELGSAAHSLLQLVVSSEPLCAELEAQGLIHRPFASPPTTLAFYGADTEMLGSDGLVRPLLLGQALAPRPPGARRPRL